MTDGKNSRSAIVGLISLSVVEAAADNYRDIEFNHKGALKLYIIVAGDRSSCLGASA